MTRLIHLNGPPAVGKSTLARRWTDDHPGTLLCDIDVLRTMVGGWQDDLVAAGAAIRSGALALMTAYAREGRDVVVPQLVADPAQLPRFAAAAAAAGADYVHVVLTAPPEEVVRRFHERDDEHPWATSLRALVERDGGDTALLDWCARFDDLVASDPSVVTIRSRGPEETYAALRVALAGKD
jgi:predicted kinase